MSDIRHEIQELRALLLDVRAELSELKAAIRAKADCPLANRKAEMSETDAEPIDLEFDLDNRDAPASDWFARR